MPTIDVNGTSLYYEDSGPGSSGETIAFSHGLLWGTELFAPQIAALRERYRCIAWDHRGQGRSGPEGRHTISMELVWQDAELLFDALGVAEAHVVGLSMGGFVGMRMAARTPARVRKLVLIATAADPEPTANIGKYRLLSGVSRALGVRVVAGRVAPIMLGKTILEDVTRKEEVARYTAIMTRRRDVWRAVNGVIDRAGIAEPELAQIRAPTVLIRGDEDQAIALPRAEQTVKAISGARLETVRGAGHSATVEQPEAVNRAIADFLAS